MSNHKFFNANDKLVLLMHGGLRSENGKTGLSLLRYAGHRVVAVVDRHEAGRSASEVTIFRSPNMCRSWHR